MQQLPSTTTTPGGGAAAAGGRSRVGITRWVLTVLTALLSGSATVVVLWATELLVGWRTEKLATNLAETAGRGGGRSWWTVFGLYVWVSWMMAFAAAFLCLYWPGCP